MLISQNQVLCVSEQPEIVQRIRKIFAREKLFVALESSIDALVNHFEHNSFDVVLLSSSVCRRRGKYSIEVISNLAELNPRTQFLTLVEPQDIRVAMEALKAGSFQYAKVPVSDEELRLLIVTALEQANSGETVDMEHTHFENLIGSSAQMQNVYKHLKQAATTEVPVLLLGETGTGKDLAAQAIHAHSRRKSGPYIPVNLGALPPDLVATELFGHEKGAFTGAVKQHKGKFEQAKDGTIFLDEIDTIDEKIQVSLLRVLEQSSFQRIGGQKYFSTNARLIAASNQDLEELALRGSFRQDLFFRLDVFRIAIPPLRERHGDLRLLARAFLETFNYRFRKNVKDLAPETLALLEGHDWPGNVRELKNVIQRALLLCEDTEILPEHLPPRFLTRQPKMPKLTFEIGMTLDEVEREVIGRTLDSTNNTRKEAAALLGITRRAIYNNLAKHDLN